MTVRMNWREDAACRDADPELFFPIGTTGPGSRQAEEAKRVCRTCPAQSQCLAWALDNGVTDGVWGATTADERRRLRSLPVRATALTTGAVMAAGLEHHRPFGPNLLSRTGRLRAQADIPPSVRIRDTGQPTSENTVIGWNSFRSSTLSLPTAVAMAVRRAQNLGSGHAVGGGDVRRTVPRHGGAGGHSGS